ncbi:inositol monophosphatase family protein [Buchnera aphidicola]|uniref:Inositol monophosphatase n=1 Tax=Buchnera aphidicola (Anoecia oenotherae) TaxID=1241833 RepID=A0A4D6XY21_9GAMM|nr:inositol monophosphatase family protein [Buchnera aphidicola]QCI19348.1 inositol monophosphatase [Buchnera aphidicola (Anoecia oenotherae)]
MHPILHIAIRAIRKNGNFLLQNYDRKKLEKEKKENIIYIVKKMIHMLEKNIFFTIQKSYPNHILLKNKFTPTKLNIKNVYWIINALNGTENFINNIPHFCIGISIIIKNKIEISVIYDPIKNDLFTSVKGQGSQLNGYRMRCSGSDMNDNNLIVSMHYPSNFNKKMLTYYTQILEKLILKKIIIRNSGSFLLDLAYVAAGKITCLFNFDKKNYNLYIGELQIRESGGLIKSINASNICNNEKLSLLGNFKSIAIIEEILRF